MTTNLTNNTNEYIVKSIYRDDAKLIPDLKKAYSQEKGVKINQSTAIGLALRNEHKRLCGQNGNNESTNSDS